MYVGAGAFEVSLVRCAANASRRCVCADSAGEIHSGCVMRACIAHSEFLCRRQARFHRTHLLIRRDHVGGG